MSYRFVANLKLTTNTKIFQLDIPVDLKLNQSKFEVTAITGLLKNSASVVLVTCPELGTTQSYFSVNESNNVIAQTVLTTSVSNPVNNIPTTEDLGFIVPSFIEYNPRITLQLRDENGDLISDADIDFVMVQICFFTK